MIDDPGDPEVHDTLPLIFEPQPEGGFTVTPPLLPELITEGDSFEDAFQNARDALAAVIELYQDMRRPLPPELLITDPSGPIHAEILVAAP